jgi:lysophospholipase L1-like esterase
LVLVVGVCATGCSNIPQANPNIAFMGDSITNYWWLPKTNFGVPGNKTTQMLDRFGGQVLGHSYKAVVILGGTNDIRTIPENVPFGPAIARAVENLQAMCSMAAADGLEVRIGLIPPITGETPRVVELNQAIEAMAEANGYAVVDYYTPLAGHPDYFVDGVHPNSHGYWIMRAALSESIPLDY